MRAGVLLVDKPEGPTSHDVVSWVRWVLGLRQVGHCGTLDPAASGLLILCIGPATRMASYFTAVDKCYEAKIILGVATDTWDREGQICQTAPVSAQMLEQAPTVLQAMCGSLCLQPPVYSAIKQGGKRAFASARQGEEISLSPREMNLYEVRNITKSEQFNEKDYPWVSATLRVSKGTYIRSLAVELGHRLGIPAHLAHLRRIACGSIELTNQSDLFQICELRAHPSSEGAKQKWLFQLRDNEQQLPQNRESLRTYVERHIIQAHHLLPISCLQLSSEEERSAYLFDRLLLGQAVSLAASLSLPSSELQQELCLIGQDPRTNAQTYVFGRTELDMSSSSFVLRPKRVIRMET